MDAFVETILVLTAIEGGISAVSVPNMCGFVCTKKSLTASMQIHKLYCLQNMYCSLANDKIRSAGASKHVLNLYILV